MHFAAFNLSEQFPCIGKTADDGRFYRNIIYRKIRFRHSFIRLKCRASDRFESIRRGIFFFQEIISRPERRFHNAARNAENNARAGALLHGSVAFDILQRIRADMCGTDHFHEFSRRNDDINIVTRIFLIKQLHFPFSLFGDTGHHGYCKNLFRRNIQFLRKIRFHYGAEHLLRRFRRRKLSDHMRELGFDETHPAGTAGCKHRPFF